MRSWPFIVFLLFFCSVCGNSFASWPNAEASGQQDLIEIDLIKNQIKLVDFNLGSSKVNGEFIFGLDKDNGFLTLDVEGRSITFGDKDIPRISTKLALKSGVISIFYLYLPQFIAKGDIDLTKNKLNLNIEGSWRENSSFLKGEIRVKVKAWGGISSFLTSGHLVVDGGKYKGKEFSYLRIDFLGRLPVLNITDSQLVLKNGNVVEIKGVLDLRDFSNILPDVEYEVQKVFIDQWQLFSGDNESIGLKKQLDDKIDVFVNTNGEGDSSDPQTELLYNWKDDKFLRLKMKEKGTILRLEKRRDF